MESHYWSRVLSQRVRRRRALAITAGASVGAAVLAACGSDSDDTPGATGDSITKATHTSPAQAVRGGVVRDHSDAEPRSLDPSNPQADLNAIMSHIYSTLFDEIPGKLEPSKYELRGDAAESFEISSDGLRITAKLRQGMKFHNKAPVNGRLLDAEDVLFSFRFHAENAPLRSLVWNSASPDGPVLNATAPDRSTVVINLKEPVAYMANWFASFGSFTGQILMVPKETGTTFDIRKDSLGTGPFFLKDHVPSASFTLGRHPDYYDKEFALVDEVALPIITEPAARFAQFKTGNLYVEPNLFKAEDQLALKKSEARILMYQNELTIDSSVFTFGHMPIGSNPLQDERVRQAISMSFDRDLNIDVRRNVDNFRKEGFPVRTVWNSHLAARDSWSDWWLDPQGKDFGPNAKFFRYDVAEAKKLLAAAGHPRGLELEVHYPAAVQFNRATVVEPMLFFLQEIGIRVKQNAQTDYTQGYIPLNRDASGAFAGMAYHSITGGIPATVSPTSQLVAEHLPSSGVTFHGYDAAGRGDKSGDPKLIEILAKAKIERDSKAAQALVKEAQRYLGKAMWSLTEPGGASTFVMAWPAVRNFAVYKGASQAQRLFYKEMWLDKTKAPFA